MIDRFGNAVQIAWSAKEDAWLRAIVQMGENPVHIRELHEVTGRSISAILTRIYYTKMPEKLQQHIRRKRLWRQKLNRCGVSDEPPAIF